MSHRPERLLLSRSRRRFLIGSAGVLALPFLESLSAPSEAMAWEPAAAGPSRLLLFFHGHGTIMEEFLPGPGNTPSAILQPIADAGLMHKTLTVSGVNSKVKGGHDGAPSLLTCATLGVNEYSTTYAKSPSVDYIIARHMQDGGSARRLDVGVHNQSHDTSKSGLANGGTKTYWSGDNELLDTFIRPDVIYNKIFPGGPPSQGPSPYENLLTRRQSVLDAVHDRFTTLKGRVSADDRVRLEQHATKIRELEGALVSDREALAASTCRNLPAAPSFEGASHQRLAELNVDLLAMAMGCNLFDVGTYKVYDLNELYLAHIQHPDMTEAFAGEDYHGAWHRAADGRMAVARRAFTAINRWYAELFTRLIVKLDEIDEGSGSALDHSMVLWWSDFGHGGGHSSDNLHLLFAGHAGGAELNRHVDFASTYGRDPADPYGDSRQPGNHNLAVTMTQAFGIQGDRFGDYNEANLIEPVEDGPLTL